MENIICIDSSVLIDHFRAKDKQCTFFERIHRSYRLLCISAIAQYEVLAGADDNHLGYWNEELHAMLFLPLTE